MSGELTNPHPPNILLRALYERFFSRIRVEESWVNDLRRLSAEGSVVHVLGTLNRIDCLALDYLTQRFGLPRIRFVNDRGLWVLNPSNRSSIWDLAFPRSPAAQLRYTIAHGGAAVLFLRRPWGVDGTGAAGRLGPSEGEELVDALFELQRERERPIWLIPHVFVWTRRPERSPRPLDVLLEPSEWPNVALTVAQLMLNYGQAALQAGEPLNLREYLASSPETPDADLQKRASYVLLRRLDRERRSVTGPARKPADRVRLEIVRSPRLRNAIEDLAGERDADRTVLTGQALAMLRELQARPDPAVHKGLGVVFHQVFSRVYAGLEYDPADIERLRRASKEGPLVLLPSHKSHFDYFFLSYVFDRENLPLPLIAAGDNLNFFPVGSLLRRGGAFFIRRSFKGDRLYAAVVDAYVRRLIREGHSIELFLEGTRSRTGKLLPPKFGLLNMIVDAALSASESAPEMDTAFVPVSIGYERVAELRAYERELKGFEKKKENTAELLKTPEVLRHRLGRINLQVGHLVSLREIREELAMTSEKTLTPARRRAIVMRIGNRTMDEINRVTAVTPGGLTALALLNDPPRRTISHDELYQRCDRLLEVLRSMGARVTPATAAAGSPLRREALREAMQMFIEAELVSVLGPGHAARKRGLGRPPPEAGEGQQYLVPESKRLALDLSKNTIVHFFVNPALVATAFLMSGTRPQPVATVKSRVQRLSRLFKHEFRFRANAAFEDIFDQTLRAMAGRGEVTLEGGDLEAGAGSGGLTGAEWLTVYANMLKNFLEGYRVAARAVTILVKGPLPEKEVVKRALYLGSRMVSGGEIERREGVCKPIIENALAALVDHEYVRRNDGRLELAESFRSAKAASAIEHRIAGFMEEV